MLWRMGSVNDFPGGRLFYETGPRHRALTAYLATNKGDPALKVPRRPAEEFLEVPGKAQRRVIRGLQKAPTEIFDRPINAATNHVLGFVLLSVPFRPSNSHGRAIFLNEAARSPVTRANAERAARLPPNDPLAAFA
jgi:hypothetical protein